MLTAGALPRLLRSEVQWQRELDRCRAEIASAEAASTFRIAAWGCGLRTKAACHRSGTLMSSI